MWIIYGSGDRTSIHSVPLVERRGLPRRPGQPSFPFTTGVDGVFPTHLHFHWLFFGCQLLVVA